MNIRFYFLLFVFLIHLNARVFSLTAAVVEEEGVIPWQRGKLDNFLSSAKPEKLTIDNKTLTSITLSVQNFYHPDFDEEDFSLNIDTAVIFSSDYQILRAGRGSVLSGVNGAPQVLFKPYRDKTEETAVILMRRINILPGASEIIEGLNSAYIGGLTCETPNKRIVQVLNGELKFIIEDNSRFLLNKADFENNQIPDTNQGQFLKYLFESVFKEHKVLFKNEPDSLRRKNFYTKIRRAHEDGMAMIGDQAEAPTLLADLKIPQISHSVAIRKRGEPLLSEDQKRWFSKTIQTLPHWQNILWVVEDPSTIRPEDLGDINGKVEIRNIHASGLGHLTEIQNLIRLGRNQHAAVFIRYATLSKYGGVARDLNTEIIRDLSLFNRTFDFYAGLGRPITQILHHGIIAAKANHPLINRAHELSAYHTSRSPSYLSNLRRVIKASAQQQEEVEYQVKYGKGPLNLAFYGHATPGKDMVFGSNAFSPQRISTEILSSEDPRLVLTSEVYVIDYSEG